MARDHGSSDSITDEFKQLLSITSNNLDESEMMCCRKIVDRKSGLIHDRDAEMKYIHH